MPRNRGEWSAEVDDYTYDDEFRDAVFTDADHVYLRRGKGEYAPKGLKPGVNNGWEQYWEEGSRKSFMAIDTALIDGANIGGFMINGGRMVSQNMPENTKPLPEAKLILDGTTGFFKCVDAQVDGEISSGSMFYKVKTGGGSLEGYTMAYGSGDFDLPLVDSSKAVTLKAYCSARSRSDYLFPLKIKATGNSAILIYDPELGFSRYVTETKLEFNKVYTMIGVGLGITGEVVEGERVSTWFVGASVGGSGAVADIIVDEKVIAESVRPVSGGAVYVEVQKLEKKIDAKIHSVNLKLK